MKSFLVFFVCVTLVSYYEAKGDDKPNKSNLEDDDENRHQSPGPISVGQKAAQAAAATQPRANWDHLIGVTRCYSCVDCPDTSKPNNLKTCNTYPGGKCVSYVEKYPNLKKPVYVRGCLTEHETCEEIRRVHKLEHIDLLDCKECYGDLCNTSGVARSLPDLTAALFFVVIAPMLTKYTLS